jgi:hypothetical protein
MREGGRRKSKAEEERARQRKKEQGKGRKRKAEEGSKWDFCGVYAQEDAGLEAGEERVSLGNLA